MSVNLEFTIEAEDFALGEVLSGPRGMRLSLERIVPTGTQIMPFVWASGADHEAFERNVRENPRVKELVVCGR